MVPRPGQGGEARGSTNGAELVGAANARPKG